MEIAGAARQASASSAQTGQSHWEKAAAGASLAGMLHAFKLDSALKLSLLVYLHPAFLIILFNTVYFLGEKEYIHHALFPKLLEDEGL